MLRAKGSIWLRFTDSLAFVCVFVGVERLFGVDALDAAIGLVLLCAAPVFYALANKLDT